MPPSPPPPPDRFQREIDDIIRLAERRLEHQSFGYRVRKFFRRLWNGIRGLHVHLPAAEVMGGWGLALLLISWLLTLPIIGALPLVHILQPLSLMLGILLLTVALVTSLLRNRAGASDDRMWRGEHVAYGNPYGEGFFSRLKRMFRGGR
jgi:hypothetical protein